jgi:hypothetical protein
MKKRSAQPLPGMRRKYVQQIGYGTQKVRRRSKLFSPGPKQPVWIWMSARKRAEAGYSG